MNIKDDLFYDSEPLEEVKSRDKVLVRDGRASTLEHVDDDDLVNQNSSKSSIHPSEGEHEEAASSGTKRIHH
jgi:hypothetical protein